MGYPWLWAAGVFEDFLTVRRRAAEEECLAEGIQYCDVVELIASDQEAWREFKKRVRERVKAHE